MPRKSDPNYQELLFRERQRDKKKREARGKPRRVGACDRLCPHYDKCKVNLWAVCPSDAGLLYVPLPCFAEHPEYNSQDWAMR